MKSKLITIAIFSLLISIKLQAQTNVQLPLVDNNVEYSGTINLSDSIYSKTKLFILAQSWFASTFNNSNAVIRVADRDNGILIGRGDVLYLPADGWTRNSNVYLYFYVEIDVKNGKYRYKFYNIGFVGISEVNLSAEYHTYQSGKIQINAFESKKHAIKRYEADLFFANKEINELIEKLQSKMAEVKTDNF